MHFIFKFMLICVCVSSVIAVNSRAIPISTDLLRSSEFSLMQLLMDSRALQQEHPQRTLACFDYYLPLLNTITEEYKESYELCLANGVSDRENVDDSTAPERENIESTAKSSCQLLQECSTHSNSIEYFECFANGGKENSKTMYTVSANASEMLVEVREKYRLIENEENKCTNASERVYVEQTYEANTGLQSCLKGETPVPTTPAPTTAAPVDTTTTTVCDESTTSESVETTTEEASTAAPIDTTTKIPDETTTEGSGETTETTITAEPEVSTNEPTTIGDNSSETTTSKDSSESTTEESKTSEESNESSTKEESSESTTEESNTSEESNESSTKEESNESSTKEESSESTTEESKTSEESNESSTKEESKESSTKEDSNENKTKESETKEESDSNESSSKSNEKSEDDLTNYSNARNRIDKMWKELRERLRQNAQSKLDKYEK